MTTPGTPAQDAVLIGQLREIYDAYRTAHLNRKYNAAMADSLRSGGGGGGSPANILIAIALVLLLGALVTTIAEIQILPSLAAHQVLIGATFLLLALAWVVGRQPASGGGAGDNIARYSANAAAYAYYVAALREIVNAVHNQRAVSPQTLSSFSAATRWLRELQLVDDPSPDPTLLRQCYDQVVREVSAAGLWLPPVPAGFLAQGMGMEGSIHGTRIGGIAPVAMTGVGIPPPHDWPMPGK